MTNTEIYRKKPIEIQATQWFKNGDLADDRVGEDTIDQVTGETYKQIEGAIVRFFRHPPVDPATGQISVADNAVSLGSMRHCDTPASFRREECTSSMHDHGWIDTLEGGHIVCPGDWIITGIKGERYPCKPDIFAATYELVVPA